MTNRQQKNNKSKLFKKVNTLRCHLVAMVCAVLLPRDLWVGKHYGAYTQKYKITFGQLDDRGVMQGYYINE